MANENIPSSASNILLQKCLIHLSLSISKLKISLSSPTYPLWINSTRGREEGIAWSRPHPLITTIQTCDPVVRFNVIIVGTSVSRLKHEEKTGSPIISHTKLASRSCDLGHEVEMNYRIGGGNYNISRGI